MSAQAEIASQTVSQLERPIVGQVHFSDVFPEVDGSEEWWRKTDFDSGLTVQVESSGFAPMTQVPIGLRPWLANYGLILTDDLVKAQSERVRDFHGKKLHPDMMRDMAQNAGAVIALANYAPRDEENTSSGANGSDFFLAVTDTGLEIYTTPLDFLNGLDARHRIIALYKIPTKGHPEFNGEHEQFRSARVVRTRRHPDHLEPVFEYSDREAVIAAKSSSEYPQAIPSDGRTGSIAFVDKFANTKLQIANLDQLRDIEVGKFVTLLVKNQDKDHELPVRVAEDLRSAPLGELVVYANCSDARDLGTNTGFVELMARVDGNPSTSQETAYFQLLTEIPELDPATAEIEIVT